LDAWQPELKRLYSNDWQDKKATWMLGVQAGLLNMNLRETLQALHREGQLPTGIDAPSIQQVQLFNSEGAEGDRARALWNALVQAQFPVHVFTLDPLVEEQNIYDAFSRRRELQLAMAFAVANGEMRADQAIKYSRQLSLDMATIALNRTVVAFAHENDTFGWYFHPRVQTPPEEKSNIEALARLLWETGPTRQYDWSHRRLEPGIRECEALVVMPGFVPTVRLEITSNWEKVAKPGRIKLEYEDMIDMGARVQQIKQFAAGVQDQQCYRAGDFQRLLSRVEQLEKMLPMQTYDVRLPFQYDLPGSELFDSGTKHLRPVLTGYYGLDTVSTTEDAEVFLTGRNFHPTQTHVIAAGKEVHLGSKSTAVTTQQSTTTTEPPKPTTATETPKADATKVESPKSQQSTNTAEVSANAEVEVISRELLKVRIKKVSTELSGNQVRIRVATPAGVSNELTIPLKKPGGQSTTTPAVFGYTLEKNKWTVKYYWEREGNVFVPKFSELVANQGLDVLWSEPTGSMLKNVKLSFDFKQNILLEAAAAPAVPAKPRYLLVPPAECQRLAKSLVEQLASLGTFSPEKPLPESIETRAVKVTPESDPQQHHVGCKQSTDRGVSGWS
jgi:hypothetical protein